MKKSAKAYFQLKPVIAIDFAGPSRPLSANEISAAIDDQNRLFKEFKRAHIINEIAPIWMFVVFAWTAFAIDGLPGMAFAMLLTVSISMARPKPAKEAKANIEIIKGNIGALLEITTSETEHVTTMLQCHPAALASYMAVIAPHLEERGILKGEYAVIRAVCEKEEDKEKEKLAKSKLLQTIHLAIQ